MCEIAQEREATSDRKKKQTPSTKKKQIPGRAGHRERKVCVFQMERESKNNLFELFFENEKFPSGDAQNSANQRRDFFFKR